MEVFDGAKSVRLRNEHNKYVVAHEDHIKVRLCRQDSSNYACSWFVETIHILKPIAIRLRNCHTGKYLGASNDPLLSHMSEKQVIQVSSLCTGADICVEWTPINIGNRIVLMTRGGTFLRANTPPWTDSITHEFVRITDPLITWFMLTVDLNPKVRSLSVDQEISYLEAKRVDVIKVRNESKMICNNINTSDSVDKGNRWKIVALVIKAMCELRLLLREAYKKQEKMLFDFRLYPRNYEFGKEKMVQLWMAAGYLSKEPMEVYGRRYFDKLLNKQMIIFSRMDISSGECKYITNVHDESVLQSKDIDMVTILKDDEHMAAEGMKSWCSSLQYDEFNLNTFEDLKRYCKEIRALLFVPGNGSSLKRVHADIFLVLRKVEALDLSGSHITELPGSIGNLLQLRYLDLSFTSIESLPETICCLQELQTLNLEGCKQLYALPKGFKNLINLRHLLFDILGQLSFMPRGIGGLTQLRTLSAFMVEDEDGCNIRELRGLNNLSGSCCITGLEKVLQESNDAVLKDKMSLIILQLRWAEYVNNDQILKSVDTSYLEPPPCLEELKMVYYPCPKLPGWICEEKCRWLKSITLRNCKNVVFGICLGCLPNLRYLCIIEMNEVVTIDDTGHAHPGEVRYPRLEKLIIEGMDSLNCWTGVKKGDFPLLCEFSIKDCPKITVLPFLSFLGSLEVLEIVNCTELVCLSDQELPNQLQTLMIEECPNLCQKYSREGGEWYKIKHVPRICIDFEDIHSVSIDDVDVDSQVDNDDESKFDQQLSNKPNDASTSSNTNVVVYNPIVLKSHKPITDKESKKKVAGFTMLKNYIRNRWKETFINPEMAKWFLLNHHLGLKDDDDDDDINGDIYDDDNGVFSSVIIAKKPLLAPSTTDYSKINQSLEKQQVTEQDNSIPISMSTLARRL